MSKKSLIPITQDDFQAKVLKNHDKIVLVDCWATWCGHCITFEPVLADFAEQHDEVVIYKLNIEDEIDVASEYKIMSLPTVLAFKNGEMVDRSIGAKSMEDLKKWIKTI
ncbi:thioredoxin [Rickettsiales bacterium]|nr:thioredoxin [Rickettsiales bacterium]